MKKSILFLSVIMISVLFIAYCETADFVWDPTGVWTITFQFTTYPWTFNEQITFSGNEDGGTVSGFTRDDQMPPQSGTWTKSGDYTLTVLIQYQGAGGDNESFDMTFNSSEDNPNSMTGTGTYLEDVVSWPFNVSATKTTNLQ